MPAQGSWVELWLGRYCAPGAHAFQPLRVGVRICVRCRKEELAGGGTCLVCGIPGEVEATLRHSSAPSASAHGRLCGPCIDEFGSRHMIKGWTLQVAS